MPYYLIQESKNNSIVERELEGTLQVPAPPLISWNNLI
jgi:hypothetical protein